MNIDWDVIKLARNALPFDRKILITKHVSGFCGTGEKMKLWQFRKDDVCPLCTNKESNYHVLKCSSFAASEIWEESINALEASLADNHTPQETIHMIAGQLHNWRKKNDTAQSCITPSLTKAVLAQDLIGWQAFMEGCLSVEWRYHASTFLPKKHSPRRWTALLVDKLWLVAFDMWDHRCKLLHKNDLSNKVQDLHSIDRRIRSILRMDTLALYPHERRVFYIPETDIFANTPKYRREWLHKAETIQKAHLKRINNPLSHRNERLVMQRWLKVIPRPTRRTASTQQEKPCKIQRTIVHWLAPYTFYAHYLILGMEYLYSLPFLFISKYSLYVGSNLAD